MKVSSSTIVSIPPVIQELRGLATGIGAVVTPAVALAKKVSTAVSGAVADLKNLASKKLKPIAKRVMANLKSFASRVLEGILKVFKALRNRPSTIQAQSSAIERTGRQADKTTQRRSQIEGMVERAGFDHVLGQFKGYGNDEARNFLIYVGYQVEMNTREVSVTDDNGWTHSEVKYFFSARNQPGALAQHARGLLNTAEFDFIRNRHGAASHQHAFTYKKVQRANEMFLQLAMKAGQKIADRYSNECTLLSRSDLERVAQEDGLRGTIAHEELVGRVSGKS